MSADDFKRIKIPISRVAEHFGKEFVRLHGDGRKLLTNYVIIRARLDVRCGNSQRPSKNVKIVRDCH